MSRPLSFLSAPDLVPFGYTVHLKPPEESARKQHLKRLFAQISRVDPQWGVALRESEVATLASITSDFTFSEIDGVVRLAFSQSPSNEGSRDPVALHHFEQILARTSAKNFAAFSEVVTTRPVSQQRNARIVEGTGSSKAAVKTKPTTSGSSGKTRAKGEKMNKNEDEQEKSEEEMKKEAKDLFDKVFAFCNSLLPKAVQLPPEAWIVIGLALVAYFLNTVISMGQPEPSPGGPIRKGRARENANRPAKGPEYFENLQKASAARANEHLTNMQQEMQNIMQQGGGHEIAPGGAESAGTGGGAMPTTQTQAQNITFDWSALGKNPFGPMEGMPPMPPMPNSYRLPGQTEA